MTVAPISFSLDAVNAFTYIHHNSNFDFGCSAFYSSRVIFIDLSACAFLVCLVGIHAFYKSRHCTGEPLAVLAVCAFGLELLLCFTSKVALQFGEQIPERPPDGLACDKSAATDDALDPLPGTTADMMHI